MATSGPTRVRSSSGELRGDLGSVAGSSSLDQSDVGRIHFQKIRQSREDRNPILHSTTCFKLNPRLRGDDDIEVGSSKVETLYCGQLPVCMQRRIL